MNTEARELTALETTAKSMDGIHENIDYLTNAIFMLRERLVIDSAPKADIAPNLERITGGVLYDLRDDAHLAHARISALVSDFNELKNLL